MTRGRLAAFALSLVSLTATAAAPPSDPQPSMTKVYREVGGESLRAHVFLPAGHGPGTRAPAILLFHGGGWSAGAPDWTFPAARRFADSGLVAIAIQYRLSNGEITPLDALADACAALGWTRGHAAELGLSGRIAGYGVSAGGQLIAATATVGCPDQAAGPDALVLWSPALDLVEDRWFASKLKGRATASDLSPALHVGRATPPTTIVHGERDSLVPVAGVKRYCAALTALGRRCEAHVYPELGHLLTRNLANQESDFDPDPRARADGIARQNEFLKELGFIAAAP